MANSLWHWLKTGGRTQASRVSRWQAMAQVVLHRTHQLRDRSDEEISGQALDLTWKIRTGFPLLNAMTDVFALVCESARRTVDMTPYPVQVMGGIALAERWIAEMQTGEGKTLTATLPTTLYAMVGRGCHVITVNDYLARRDASAMRPIYEMMGLSVECVTSESEDDERREAYNCDITYGTATEIGFDFLRDRLKSDTVGTQHNLPRYATLSSGSASGKVQRGQYFALIDEADSVLIDEAVTPLIIGLPEPNSISDVSLPHWAHARVADLEEREDFICEPDRRLVTLTEQGSLRVLMSDRPHWLGSFSNEKLLSQVETALAANLFYKLDREYVVNEGDVTIVDESTGRMMEGRKWQRGLHQAIEVKEGTGVTELTQHAAQITIQSLFRHYRYLAGMTGTAMLAKKELWTGYRVGVAEIPTNRPCLRQEVPTRIYATHSQRNQVLTDSVVELVRQKRAVLIGTPSVSESEALGQMLNAAGTRYVILNARHEAEEAEIVELAGQPGRVTIATNMAGRGTDIIPHPEVIQHGGVHVIATSVHSSARIDRQLVGRTARQGDPGTFQFLLSLEDPFLNVLSPKVQRQLRSLIDRQQEGEITSLSIRNYFRKAQNQLEKNHARQRKQLLKGERRQSETFRRIGLDPYLECAAD
ncbi:MAG: translocase [Fuerstiella sp.]|nr:translocase [Fuerstiella sp.]